MGKIATKNPSYRTKEVLVRDLTIVLNAPLSHGTKCAVLRNAAWTWTEFDGKHEGCPYWTEAAQAQWTGISKDFRHEHAVPIAVVMKMLLDVENPTEEQVRSICERFLIGVVVTEGEDELLNGRYGRTMPQMCIRDRGWSHRQCRALPPSP